jgi:hypothetical protein
MDDRVCMRGQGQVEDEPRDHMRSRQPLFSFQVKLRSVVGRIYYVSTFPSQVKLELEIAV